MPPALIFVAEATVKKSLVFVNTVTFSTTEVKIGPNHLLIVAGLLAVLARVYTMMSGEAVPYLWVAAAVVAVHWSHWRHAATPPVLISLVVGLVSFGLSLLVSGLIINRMVAQHYRDRGWKIRQQGSELGEYSSRFLAVDELGFKDSDLMESVVRTHLQPLMAEQLAEQEEEATVPAAFVPSRQMASSRMKAVFSQEEGAGRSDGRSGQRPRSSESNPTAHH